MTVAHRVGSQVTLDETQNFQEWIDELQLNTIKSKVGFIPSVTSRKEQLRSILK